MSVLQVLIAPSSATAFSTGISLSVRVNTCTVPEVSLLPGNALEDGYDDATEDPGPMDASLSGQNEQENIGIPDESERKKDPQTGEARRAVLLVLIIHSYCTRLGEKQGGGYIKQSCRFYLTTVRQEHSLAMQRVQVNRHLLFCSFSHH